MQLFKPTLLTDAQKGAVGDRTTDLLIHRPRAMKKSSVQNLIEFEYFLSNTVLFFCMISNISIPNFAIYTYM